MRLTGFGLKGLCFYLAMAGAFYASPYSNLFFLLLAFLTLQWILCALATRRNVRGVRAEFAAMEPVSANSPQELRVRLEAPGRSRFLVGVELLLPGRTRVAAHVDVLRRSGELVLPLPPLERGIYPLGAARVASSYPLALLRASSRVETPTELVVYPEAVELGSARTSGAALDEVLGDRLAGAGDLQPSGLREHREGDELRSVHWRATARTGKLVVKEWDGGGGEGLEVSLDRRCSSAALEESLSILSALVALARTNKEVLALSSQDLNASFGDGHRPFAEALRFLAEAQPLPASAPAPPPVARSVARLPLATSGSLPEAGEAAPLQPLGDAA